MVRLKPVLFVLVIFAIGGFLHVSLRSWFSVSKDMFWNLDEVHRELAPVVQNLSKKDKFSDRLLSNIKLLLKHSEIIIKSDINLPPDFNAIRQNSRTFSQLFRLRYNFKSNLDNTLIDQIAWAVYKMERRMYPWLKFGQVGELMNGYGGRGIVMSVGNKQFKFAVHTIMSLRGIVKTSLPIQVVYRGLYDLSVDKVEFLSGLPDVTVLDATRIFQEMGGVEGWAFKPFAILGSRFEEAIFIDADVVFLQVSVKWGIILESDPVNLFNFEAYKKTGTVFFYDRTVNVGKKPRHAWVKSFLSDPSEALKISRFWNHQTNFMQESGVVVVDKRRAFTELLTVCMLNYGKVGIEAYNHIHGDKETFWLGWELNIAPYQFIRNFGGSIGYIVDVSWCFLPKKNTWTDLKSETLNFLDVGRYVCGPLLHSDESGNPMWWNGGLVFNKEGDHDRIVEFTHWAEDRPTRRPDQPFREDFWDVKVGWRFVPDSTIACMSPSQVKTDVHELSKFQKTLIFENVKLWKDIRILPKI
ncbi:hypothetical protein HK096_010761 [Nowakowskiella sp. JEL0078]|nr:hypothetical protein HK096_010761 [Nowakowskiella sp. JEL0078]